MKLIIGPNLIDNKVRLDFKASPENPKRIPSYTIQEDKADEFVKEYNTQAETLKKDAKIYTGIGGVLGGILALISSTKHKIFHSTLGLLIGITAGGLLSAIVSYEKKNNLMDKYNVEKYKN